MVFFINVLTHDIWFKLYSMHNINKNLYLENPLKYMSFVGTFSFTPKCMKKFEQTHYKHNSKYICNIILITLVTSNTSYMYKLCAKVICRVHCFFINNCQNMYSRNDGTCLSPS